MTDIRQTPSLRSRIEGLVGDSFAEYMFWESPGNWRWAKLYDLFPEWQLAVLDTNGELVATLDSVPALWDGTVSGLPGGFDDLIVNAVDAPRDTVWTASSALSLTVGKEHRKAGLPELLLTELRRRSGNAGHRGVLAPVRPTAKVHYPLVPMSEYMTWTDANGRLFDPWLRTHRELGADVVAVAERSLVIRQPVSRWEGVYGRPMPGPGGYLMPGCLTPVQVGTDRMGTYAEPNVWAIHPCRPEAGR
ncbi:hypothetical protein CFN78_11700 [Amycolatopsis antarctica]|uniref:GNAT family N-acetyltransferase n=1 Tax=Amycolatopsis antarctica TaxID=1854586 RepID=A0A263D3P5_9PSEU|nr:hypothetical protein CFN78_11700 [Amycolatopsis antarctica]